MEREKNSNLRETVLTLFVRKQELIDLLILDSENWVLHGHGGHSLLVSFCWCGYSLKSSSDRHVPGRRRRGAAECHQRAKARDPSRTASAVVGGQMDGQMDGRMGGRMGGRISGQMGGQIVRIMRCYFS
jgi:hypothetical protein